MNAYLTESIEDIDGTEFLSMYDKQFKFPGYLTDALIEMCTQSLMNYQKIPYDLEDNNRDEPN
jgi:hypothetical protein